MKTKIYLLTLVAIFSVKFSSGQVILNYFNGNQSTSNIDLTWQSANEMNMDFYSVERGLDSINYTLIQNITASGNSNIPHTYSYTDISSFADTCYYYRIMATAYNGVYQYLDTVKICYNSALTSIADVTVNLFYNVYPNPVTNGLLNIESTEYENCTLNILNQIGQNALTIKTISKKTLIDCSKFNSGLYYLQLVKINGQTSTEKFIVD